MTEDDDEEFPGEIHPASKEEWLALTRRTPMTEAEKERAAIVRWLRRRELLSSAKHIRGDEAIMQIADAIESGEHLKEGR